MPSVLARSPAGLPKCPASKVFRTKGSRRGKVVCHGILDSYRQAQVATESKKTPELPSMAGAQNSLAFESQDEDTCPAECVVEVSSPADFKAKCEVCHRATTTHSLFLGPLLDAATGLSLKYPL